MKSIGQVKLSNKINEAFKSVRCPNLKELIHRDCSESEDYLSLELLTKNKRWNDISTELIEDNHDLLSVVSSSGFQFLLPAYMQWAIIDGISSKSTTLDNLLYSLNPRSFKGLYIFQKSKYEELSIKQIKVIICFLEYIAKTHCEMKEDAEKALKFWNSQV